ncbi:MAG TPA: hypothetical protein VJ902_03835 [Wenzhouxiangellaceae bacterium]|nr:hypothetical protein [Wenzhouxiangellaceae bacterium]
MNRLCIAAIFAALITAGCGESETEAPQPQESRPAAASSSDLNGFLVNIDADTTYFYANLERLPEAVVDKAWAMSEASAKSNETIFDALAEDEEVTPEIAALINEVKALSTREGWEAAGMHANPFYAFYGVDLMPFAELELSDGAAFNELIARVESDLEQPLQRRDINGVEVVWFELAEGFGIAMTHDQDSVTAALIPDDAAMLARVAGQYEPADAMGSDAFEAFNQEIGFSSYGSGFMDWQRMVNDLMTGDTALARLAHGDESFTSVVENPACVAEYQAVTEALPRLVFGYTRMTESNADFLARQETSAKLAASLAPIAQAPVSIDRDLSGLFNFGLAFDLVAGREFARGLVAGWVANPPQCPSFKEIAAQAPALQENLNRPIPPIITNLHGLFLEAETFSFADGIPTGGGTLSFFMRNPQLLVGMAQMFSPAVAEMQLEPGGEPLPVPEGAIPQLQQANLKAWLAMGENAIGIAIGEENVDALTSAIEATSADEFLMAGRMDFRMLLELVDVAESALGDMDSEEAAMGLDAQRAQYEALAEIYDQASFKIRLGEKGIDFVAESTLK